MADDSLIEEMRAAVRGDRERARQRQLAARTPHTAAAVTDPEVELERELTPEQRIVEPEPPATEPLPVEPEPVDEPVAAEAELPAGEPVARRRWWSFRRHAGT